MNKQGLFVASCLSIGTASVVFAIRGDVAGPLSQSFHITNEQMGVVFSPAFWAFTMAIFISGNLVDIVGMRRLHILSALGFIAGVVLIILAPHPDRPVVSLFDHIGTMLLYTGFFLFGLSHGLVEGVINPLMASLYTHEKTRRITAVHAWWPAGLVIGGVLAVAMTDAGATWQLKLCLILVPAIAYLMIARSLQYPKTERAVSNVSTADMWKQAARPLFLLLFACMWMTAATEMGPDQWFPRVMGELVPQLSPQAGSGVLFLVYTGGLMFVLRIWGSAVTHKSPILTMIVSSLLSAVACTGLARSTRLRVPPLRSPLQRSSASARRFSGRPCSASLPSNFPEAARCSCR
jgi:MFS family permease